MNVLLAATLLIALNGNLELELDRIAQKFGLTHTTEAATGRETLRAPGLTVSFAPGLRVALVNGDVVSLSSPVEISGGRIRLPADLAALLERLAPPQKSAPGPSGGPKRPHRAA